MRVSGSIPNGEEHPSLLFLAAPRGACGTLVPQPGIEPVPPAVEVQSLNHWTAREVLEHAPFCLFLSVLTGMWT